MGLFRCLSGDGGGSVDLEQYYYDKVYNNPNVSAYYDMTVQSSNVTITKGRYAIDTVDEKVYVYYDLIGAKNVTSSSGSASQGLTVATIGVTYFPYSSLSARFASWNSIIDALNSTKSQCHMYGDTNNGSVHVSRYAVKTGQQYKGYGEWSYHNETQS